MQSFHDHFLYSNQCFCSDCLEVIGQHLCIHFLPANINGVIPIIFIVFLLMVLLELSRIGQHLCVHFGNKKSMESIHASYCIQFNVQYWKTVIPSLFIVFISMFLFELSRTNLTISLCPFWQANINGVNPWLGIQFNVYYLKCPSETILMKFNHCVTFFRWRASSTHRRQEDLFVQVTFLFIYILNWAAVYVFGTVGNWAKVQWTWNICVVHKIDVDK